MKDGDWLSVSHAEGGSLALAAEPLSRALAVVLCDGEGQGEGCEGKGEPDCVREPPTAGESKVSVGVAEPSMDDFADALGIRLAVPVSPP